jgi:hypothetical protein
VSTQICRGFTDQQWRELEKRLTTSTEARHNEAVDRTAWDCAITVFERRVKERFFSCIEALEEADKRCDVEVASDAPADCSTLPNDVSSVVVPGFAIVGLCCLLIETLASFGETDGEPLQQPTGPCPYPSGNCIRPQSPGGKLIRDFLQRPSFGEAFKVEKVARDFVRGIRDGIFHEAETRKWMIWREDPKDSIVETKGKQHFLNRTAFVKALRQEFECYLADLRDPQKSALRMRFVKKMNDIVKEI